ncbi:unnamed protein product [Clavelina lepadiformis]|uniref:Uncharacterized protein n=1 Tax=Clavelina lepadiformis TaxID=159417 RepID=A0ABP0GB21_CLALP
MGQTIESDHISELTEEEYEEKYLRENLRLKGFAYIDAKYLVPFFTRRITKRVRAELKDAHCRRVVKLLFRILNFESCKILAKEFEFFSGCPNMPFMRFVFTSAVMKRLNLQ